MTRTQVLCSSILQKLSNQFHIFLKEAENFNQLTILLLKSFLKNVTQCVKLGNDLADKITIIQSVPQEIVPEPLICVRTSHCVRTTRNCVRTSEKLEGENDFVQIADDTSIICKFESNENIPLKLRKLLEQTDKYLTENQLTLNADKKKDVILYKSHQFGSRV